MEVGLNCSNVNYFLDERMNEKLNLNIFHFLDPFSMLKAKSCSQLFCRLSNIINARNSLVELIQKIANEQGLYGLIEMKMPDEFKQCEEIDQIFHKLMHQFVNEYWFISRYPHRKRRPCGTEGPQIKQIILNGHDFSTQIQAFKGKENNYGYEEKVERYFFTCERPKAFLIDLHSFKIFCYVIKEQNINGLKIYGYEKNSEDISIGQEMESVLIENFPESSFSIKTIRGNSPLGEGLRILRLITLRKK